MPAPPAPPIADIAPTQAQLTDYDRAQLATYLRLLDAASEGAPWEEVARIVLDLDPALEPDRRAAPTRRIWRAPVGSPSTATAICFAHRADGGERRLWRQSPIRPTFPAFRRS